MTVQRDWGDRSNRKAARLKYTIEKRGLPAFRAEVESRVGRAFEDPKPFAFDGNGDRYGWTEGEGGRQHLTLFIENGRIRDDARGPRLLSGLRRLAEIHDGEFRLTANQNVIVANVSPERRPEIEAVVAEFGLTDRAGALRRNSMACVALPTCGLALAESERYLPSLLDRLEERLAAHRLAEDEITIRMTGCPNGCARPYIAEIGLVGRGPDRYHLYLGGAFDGSRLSKLYAPDIDEAGILGALDPLFRSYAAERRPGERFGDFVIRAGFVADTKAGRHFHDDVGPVRAAA
jgi:sulfite reductase (NADPH) hemoprotein beta-component